MSQTSRTRRSLSVIRRGRWPRRRGLRGGPTAGDIADVRSIEYEGTSWIDVRNPTPDVLEDLRERYGLHPLVVEDVLSRIQRPKIDEYDDYLFVVMQIPIHDPETRRNESSEIDMVVGRDFFMTFHDGNLRPLIMMVDSIFESDAMSIKLLRRTPGHLLYEVVDRLIDYVVPIVPRLEIRVERIEEMIFQSHALETVHEISLVRRDLISLRRILKPQLAILNRFELGTVSILDAEINDYWSDISDHLARTIDSIEELSELVKALADTHDTLISQRMNDIIKTLTIFAVIMMPLTLLSGIFGMNVPLPQQDAALTTIVIMTAMLLISVVMLLYFRRKQWI